MERPIVNLQCEGEYIKQCLINKNPSLVYSVLQTCKCGPHCGWDSLKEGLIFSWQGRKYRTSGNVFVCKRSLKIHKCGVDHCFNYGRASAGEGVVCEITGMWLDREYAVNTNWYEPDVRCVGMQSYTHNTQHIVEKKLNQINELSAIAPVAYEDDTDGFLANSMQFFQQAEDARMYIESSQQTSKTRTSKTSKKNKTFDETLMSIGSAMDIERVMQRFSNTSEQNIVAKLHLRVRWRSTANDVWDALTVSQRYIEEAKDVAEQASAKWDHLCRVYVKDCYDSNLECDYIKILFMWLRYVAPSMKNIVYGDKIVRTNNKHKDYYIECMLRIWELLDDIPVIKTNLITFSMCAPAILTKLSQGLVQTVYFKPDDPKPYIKDAFNEHLLTYAVPMDIAFISPHPKLVLVSTSEVRKQSPNASQRKASGQDVRLRRTKQPTGIIPSTKSLNKIYLDIIIKATSIDDLTKRIFK